jgi:hypothetical protein
VLRRACYYVGSNVGAHVPHNRAIQIHVLECAKGCGTSRSSGVIYASSQVPEECTIERGASAYTSHRQPIGVPSNCIPRHHQRQVKCLPRIHPSVGRSKFGMPPLTGDARELCPRGQQLTYASEGFDRFALWRRDISICVIGRLPRRDPLLEKVFRFRHLSGTVMIRALEIERPGRHIGSIKETINIPYLLYSAIVYHHHLNKRRGGQASIKPNLVCLANSLEHLTTATNLRDTYSLYP